MSLFCGMVSPGRDLKEDEINLFHRMIESLCLNKGHSESLLPDNRLIAMGIKYNPKKENPLDEQRQPLKDEKGKIFLFFDGFLANSDELRSHLENKDYIFTTQNNAEAIIHLYQEEGTNSFKKLNGEFVFALYDSLKKLLYLVRDKTGTRPLYYAILHQKNKKDGLIIFTNQMGTLLHSRAVPRELNEEGLYHFFTYGAVPPPLTLIKGIKKIPAGNFIELKISKNNSSSKFSNELIPRTYWLPIPQSTPTEADENYYIEKVRDLLISSVTRRIKNNKKLSIPLGGMDSSALVALARQKDVEMINTYTLSVAYSTVKDEMVDVELSMARRIKDIFKTKHHEMIIKEEDFINLLPRAVEVSPEPCAYYALPEIYHLTKRMAEEDADTVLLGTLADAIFLDSIPLLELCRTLESPWSKILFSKKPIAQVIYWLNSLFEKMKGETLLPGLKTKIFEHISKGHEPYLGHKIYLQDFQKKFIFSDQFLKRNEGLSTATLVDLCASKMLEVRPDIKPVEKCVGINLMLVNPETVITHLFNSFSPHSIQPRFPYVDSDLLDFVLGIPLEIRMKNGIQKYLLKKALEGLIPDHAIEMKKIKLGRAGYQVLRKNLTEKLSILLKTSPLLKEGDYFHLDSIKKLLYLHSSEKLSLESYLYPLLVFLYWHELWIEGKDPESMITL